MIETERLFIRPWRESDTSHYMAMASDIGYTEFSPPGYYAVENAEGARQKIIPRIQLFNRCGLGKFPLFLKGNGEFIGTCGLDSYDLQGDAIVELGYRLLLRSWGKGFASEAAKALLQYGFKDLGLGKIYAFALPQNAASLKVIEKLQMEPQGECLHAGALHRLFVAHNGASPVL